MVYLVNTDLCVLCIIIWITGLYYLMKCSTSNCFTYSLTLLFVLFSVEKTSTFIITGSHGKNTELPFMIGGV